MKINHAEEGSQGLVLKEKNNPSTRLSEHLRELKKAPSFQQGVRMYEKEREH